jgi:hypothetical protein
MHFLVYRMELARIDKSKGAQFVDAALNFADAPLNYVCHPYHMSLAADFSLYFDLWYLRH